MNVYSKAYADQLAWLVTMATTPGWWHHSRHRAVELESHESRAFIGIRAAVRAELKRLGFNPSKDELKEIEP